MTRCDACGKEFSGLRSFDAHRTGTFSPSARRCLTTDEMTQAGLGNKAKNGKTIWYIIPSQNRELFFLKHRKREKAVEVEDDG